MPRMPALPWWKVTADPVKTGGRVSGFERVEGRDPVPVAHLTVRAKDGIWLKVTPR